MPSRPLLPSPLLLFSLPLLLAAAVVVLLILVVPPA
jgi:hypothetical protein